MSKTLPLNHKKNRPNSLKSKICENIRKNHIDFGGVKSLDHNWSAEVVLIHDDCPLEMVIGKCM